jgi:all-trans-8'-apo-beta-carotenal 15,15'-oxygenase
MGTFFRPEDLQQMQQDPRFDDSNYITWAKAVRDLPREHGFENLLVEGNIPSDLNGTLYLNGPGLFSHFGSPYKYWPDGDGAITSVKISDGYAQGACKILETKELKEERQKNQPVYGSVGTAPARWIDRVTQKYKNPANINVLNWNDRLFALYESGLPTEFDGETLEVIGDTDFNGLLPSRFAAHPHYSPYRKATYNFGIEYGVVTTLNLYELKDNGQTRKLVSIPTSWPPLIHDFIVTPNFLVFFIPPMTVKTATLLMGVGSVMDNVIWKENYGTEILVVPIDNPKKYTRFTTDAFFQWHFANAYELSDSQIAVDYVRYKKFFMVGKIDVENQKWEGDNGARGYYYRSIIDLKTKKLINEQRYDKKVELPKIVSGYEGIKHTNTFLGGFSTKTLMDEGAVDKIIRLNVEKGVVEDEFSLGVNVTFTEPNFVPSRFGRTKEEGYLLSLCYDAELDKSFLVVLDAQNLSFGYLAKIWFDHHIPPTFHGTWVNK